MRKFFIFSVLALCSFLQLKAQADTALFLFDRYEDARISFKAGGELKSKVNYNLVTDKFYFIDGQDNQEKILGNPGEVLFIKIGNRTFYPNSEGAGIEIFSTKPVLHVQYKATSRKESPAGAYGIRSETTAVQSYASVRGNGTFNNLNGEKTIITNRYHIYWAEKNGKMKQFRNLKQFMKIYSKHRDEIEKYIDENKVHYENINQIVRLCAFTDSIENQ